MSNEDDNIRSIFGANQTPRPEEVAGAVDLAAPEYQAIRNFQVALQENGGTEGAVMVGLTKNGRIITNKYAPNGGLVMLLGLLEAAKMIAIQSGNSNVPTPPPGAAV